MFTVLFGLCCIAAAAAAACGGAEGEPEADRASTVVAQVETSSPTAVPTLAEAMGGGATPAPNVTAAVVADLAARLSVLIADIEVVSLTPTTWPNTCLGLATAGQVCASMLTPGWLAILRGPDGLEYRYRGTGERFLAER